MPKDPRKEAEKVLDDAERLLEHEKFGKAGKDFKKAGDLFMELADFKVSDQCFFYAAKAFLSAEKLEEAAEVQRDAANACIMLNDYKKAEKYYQIAAKYSLRVDKVFEGILNGSFAYLCMFIQGQQDRGLEYLQQVKQKVPFDDFKENRLVQLVRSLTLSIVDRNREELVNIEKTLGKFKFRDPELRVVQRALVLARVHMSLSFELKFAKTTFITDEIVEFSCIVDTTQLADIVVPVGLEISVKSVEVKDCAVALSDNLSVKRKPPAPFPLTAGEKKTLEFQLRANFPSPEAFIGPVVLTCAVGDVVFFAKSPSQPIVVTSPPAKLSIFLKPLGTPLIGKTFQMEVILTNESDGEATNVELDLEFPPNLHLMRGLPKKTFYSIASKEKAGFQVSLQPSEAGDAPVKVTLKFSDPDGKVYGPNTAILPFEIKL